MDDSIGTFCLTRLSIINIQVRKSRLMQTFHSINILYQLRFICVYDMQLDFIIHVPPNFFFYKTRKSQTTASLVVPEVTFPKLSGFFFIIHPIDIQIEKILFRSSFPNVSSSFCFQDDSLYLILFWLSSLSRILYMRPRFPEGTSFQIFIKIVLSMKAFHIGK